jgi:TolB-like protein/lipopolysaccharide biosynthesis regulator YciM
MANEDHPDNNLNKTFYRNQINKVANAIKEVISAIKLYDSKQEEELQEAVKPMSAPRKNHKTTIIAGLVIVLVLIVLGFLFVPKLFKPSGELEKSIAVLPFNLLSDEPDKQYLADGMMDAITLHLSKIKDLRVLGRTSTEQYRNPTKTLTAIGKELDVSYLLEGSFQKFGDSVRLIVQLIKTGKEGHAWANNYDRSWKNVFSVQSEVAQSIARELNVVITPDEKQQIEKIPTTNLTAYDFYQRGTEELLKYYYSAGGNQALKRAELLFKQALNNDSTFTLAYIGLAEVYYEKHYYESYLSKNFLDSVLILANKSLDYDENLADGYLYRAYYYMDNGNMGQALKELDKTLEFDPNSWAAYRSKSQIYADDFNNMDFVKAIENSQKAVGLNHGKERPILLRSLGATYSQVAGFINKGENYYKEALILDGDTISYYNSLALTYYGSGYYDKAIDVAKRSYEKDTTNIEATIDDALVLLGECYEFMGRYKESFPYLQKYSKKLQSIRKFVVNVMHRIGYAYWMNGYKNEGEYWLNEQIKYCEESIKKGRLYSSNQWVYFDLAGVYAFKGNKREALENLEVFRKTHVCPLWLVTLMKFDPLFNSIRNEPEFQQIQKNVEAKYQAEHERVRKWLEENNML